MVCETCDGFYNGCTMVGNPIMETCPTCKGEGRIHFGYNEAIDEHFYDYCSSCEGTGKCCVGPDPVEEEVDKESLAAEQDDLPF